jgi:hypothetical protein
MTEDEDDLPIVEIEEPEDDGEDLEETVEAKPERFRKSPCPKNDKGHEIKLKQEKFKDEYVCIHCGKKKWTNLELEELITNVLLREDANRELCRQCLEEEPESLPYGYETGAVEYQPAMDKEGNALFDEETGDTRYVEFPELQCDQGHRWYKGEGPRRDIRGKNPILFEPHLYNRKRRELLAKEGVVDPAYTMDRWGKRPTTGLYGRSHPQGRKINSRKARKSQGAGFYR